MTRSKGIRRRVTGTLEERFWKNVQKSDGCWTWLGWKDQHGYGHIGDSYEVHKAHRLSFRLNIGTIPDGLHVLHSCDNPSCVNPAHLSVGTHLDNMRDMFTKKRRRYCVPKGEVAGNAKLTDAQCANIRICFALGARQRDVAEWFDIGQSHAHRIKAGASRASGTGWVREGE